MSKYNKLWVALVLGGVYVAMKYYGVLPEGFDPIVIDAVSSAITALGVYAVPNK